MTRLPFAFFAPNSAVLSDSVPPEVKYISPPPARRISDNLRRAAVIALSASAASAYSADALKR